MPVSGGVTGQQKDGEGKRVCPFKPGNVSGKRLCQIEYLKHLPLLFYFLVS